MCELELKLLLFAMTPHLLVNIYIYTSAVYKNDNLLKKY